MHNPADSDDARLYRRTPSPSTQEYQTKLLDKLTALIGVIDIAISRVRASMARRQGDPTRLQEILDNLNNTRAICLRARSVIEKRLGTNAPRVPASRTGRPQESARVGYRQYVEMQSADEIRKFKGLAPISEADVKSCNIDGLLRQILSDGADKAAS
ncbi:MAG: hypothetical protein AB1486_16425 [Planctomycetota bacterium]